MIYKVYLIDANNGISILESTFKEFEDPKINSDLFPGFFNIINKIIDKIQQAMLKKEKINELLRVIEAEQSTILIFFHPDSKVLFCSISDTDDDINKLKEVMRKIASRFWKKHQSDLRLFRSTSNKSKFQSIIVDIENLTIGGKIAETFPKILVVPSVLDKIYSMGLINDLDHKIALNCNGSNSPKKISQLIEVSKEDVYSILKKLKELDIILI
ncbi:MAG: hypothetical protein ACFFBP_16560 [Promethearchaeota archaeon]